MLTLTSPNPNPNPSPNPNPNPNPIPNPSPNPNQAMAALKSFANRKFDGRVVAVSHLPEADFHTLKDGE